LLNRNVHVNFRIARRRHSVFLILSRSWSWRPSKPENGRTGLCQSREFSNKLAREGVVKILGLDPWENGSVLHKKIGIIPQNFTFFNNANPWEAVKYDAILFGVSLFKKL
jgi:hypothetical protein